MKEALFRAGWHVSRIPRVERMRSGSEIPDAALYRPLFSPWLGGGEFGEVLERVRPFMHNSPDRAFVLWTLARQASVLGGEIWECGVYRDGTAMLLAGTLARGGRLRLFDTFQGMPETDPERDLHRAGDFADTSLEAVRARFGARDDVSFHAGRIPATFAGLEGSRIALAHVDVDIYQSVLDCCEFVHPRLVPGGFLVFDDYGFPSCPGARQAVDEFYAGRPERPLVLASGQAIVFRAGD